MECDRNTSEFKSTDNKGSCNASQFHRHKTPSEPTERNRETSVDNTGVTLFITTSEQL